MHRVLLLPAMLALLVLGAACEDKGDAEYEAALAAGTSTSTPTPTPAAAAPTPTPTAPPTPGATPPSPSGPRRTGDASLDAIIEAVEGKDVPALIDRVQLIELPCRVEPNMSWFPACEEGEPEGTLIAGIPSGACEGSLRRDVWDALAEFLDDTDGVWALVRPSDSFGGRPWDPPDGLLVFHDVVAVGDSPIRDIAKYVEVRDGQVIGLGAACVGGIEELGDVRAEVLVGPWDEPRVAAEERLTGDADLDAIITAVAAEDVDTLLGVLRTQQVECATVSQGIGGLPLCAEEDVEPGTVLTVATGASCEGYQTPQLRELVGHFVEHQDGLYAAPDGGDDYTHLLFHGQLDAGGGLELWVRDGTIQVVQIGCIVDVETRADFLGASAVVGPWPWPASSFERRVARLLGPVLEAIERGDAASFRTLRETPFSVRGCSTLPEEPNAVFDLLAADGRLHGVYERMPNVWWLVYEVDGGAIRLELRTPQNRVQEFVLQCSGAIEELSTDGIGRQLTPIALPVASR